MRKNLLFLLLLSSFSLLGESYQLEILNKDDTHWVSDISAVRSILFPADQLQVNLRSGDVKTIAKSDIRKVIFKVATANHELLETSLIVYPTVVKDYVQIMNTEDTLHSLEMYSIDGKMISSQKLIPGLNVLNVSLLNSGIYILRSGEKTFKIIKE